MRVVADARETEPAGLRHRAGKHLGVGGIEQVILRARDCQEGTLDSLQQGPDVGLFDEGEIGLPDGDRHAGGFVADGPEESGRDGFRAVIPGLEEGIFR